MRDVRQFTAVFHSARTWIALGVLAPLGLLVVCAVMLLELRRDAWDKAQQTSTNLLQVIERDIARNVEIVDLSLQAVVDGLKIPAVTDASPELRQMILFDRAATARDLGVLLVLNEKGDITLDAVGFPAREGNYDDRDYFRAQKERSDIGLYVGRPVVSRLTGERILPLSRRIDKPDGSFGGVVLGTMKLSYFTRLFEHIGLGQDGAINLYHRDGTRIMRHPFAEADIGVSIAGSSNYIRFVTERRGSFVADSVRDGIRRHYAYTKVDGIPLFMNVALSADDIESEWWAKATVLGSIVLVLCSLTAALSVLFGRELRRRAAVEAELAQLSMTDQLTGLPNRRRFEATLLRAWKTSDRSGVPLSLLMIDADHFKRFNDLYGHAVGDTVLQGLASALNTSVHRPDDLVCRFGGEEFVVILPGTDLPGALKVAEKIHAQVGTLAVPQAGRDAEGVTVSVGVACTADTGSSSADALLRSADEAVYKAKERGRNRTECANAPVPVVQAATLRLVAR